MRRQGAHLLIQQLGAALTNLDQQAADRVAVRAGHPFCAADRIALDQAVDDLNPAAERNAVHGVCIFP